jgi:hypothetical protein
METNS